MIVDITHKSKLAGSLGFALEAQTSRRALQGLPPRAHVDYPETFKEAAHVSLYRKGADGKAFESVNVISVKVVEV